MSRQINARQAALEMLKRCRRDGAWSGDAIDSAIRKHVLDKRDAALAARLCLGVLQNRRLCDYYIDFYCRTRLEPVPRDILRLGVYQLLFLDRVPARAAVNETVALCKSNGCARAAGLVNAVLRRISGGPGGLPEIPGEGTAEYLSIRYSHPLRLARELIADRGYAFAEAFFAANNSPAPLCLQINRLKTTPAAYAELLREKGIAFRLSERQPDCILLEGGLAAELPGYAEGLFYVQDPAARAAVSIAAPKPGMRVLDACASPGGKSFAAAIEMDNRGLVLACDIHENKLARVRSGAGRLGVTILETRPADARDFDPALAERFDLVIADVPCSGFGVIRKKPEIREKDWESLAGLPELQSEILANLSRYVAPGGVLLYSTCTVLPEENERVVERFLRQHTAFTAEPFRIFGEDAPDGMFAFWPQLHGTDGFFAAKLRKMDCEKDDG